MSSKGYIRKEVAEYLCIKPSTIEVYVKRGLVIPEVDNPKGKGTRRRFSKRNILEILIVQRLVKKGFSLEQVKDILYFFRIMDSGPTMNKENLPEILTESQKQRLIKNQDAFRRFWDLDNWNDNWDKRNDAYLLINDWDGHANGGQDAMMITFIPRKGGKVPINVDENTNSVFIIKLTDLRVRVIRI